MTQVSVRPLLSAPFEFISQYVKVIPVRRLDDVEGRAAFADDDAVAGDHCVAYLPVEREDNILCLVDQFQFDLG